MARGNERQPIYLDDADRRRFLGLLERACERYRWRCLAYCLMGNHYHLVVETPLPNLSRGMRLLNAGYATGFNVRYERVGHLFQGRFRSVIIRSPEHLLLVLKYVIRNPVAAGYCAGPEGWPWSSYRATVTPHPRSVVAADATLAWFGDDGESRRRFAAFMSNEDGAPLEDLLIGDVEFPCHPTEHVNTGPALEAVLAAAPGAAGIALAYHEHGYSLRQIAAALGRSRATVGRQLVVHQAAEMLNSAT